MPLSHKVILCGNNRVVAATARDLIQPEYTSVYSSFSIADALSELPSILTGVPPAPSSLHTSFVTTDYPPGEKDNIVAVVLGAGYDDAAATALHAACVQACAATGTSFGVPFVRQDLELTAKLSKDEKAVINTTQSQTVLIRRLKDRLRTLEEGEKLRHPFVWY